MALAIKVEDISKMYRLGQFNTGALSQDFERWWALFRGKEDPFLKIGEVNDRSTSGKSNVVWSLKDINLEIEQGEAVGIIGKNGAGKSTLLKVLSRVTSPTSGRIGIKGRIASLLEVGTGFHPELTGRENIFLNGAILGMRKKEIRRRFDEIVDFAGVERYIDTPVKRYSSGMYVRLAFAVSAHLESEILIVDEVLAVGDAEFQKKCIGKMGEISKGQGRTILFVSHNMVSVRSICTSGLHIANGTIISQGPVESIVSEYQSQSNPSRDLSKEWDDSDAPGDQDVRLLSASVQGSSEEGSYFLEEEVKVVLRYKVMNTQEQLSTSIHLIAEGVCAFAGGNPSEFHSPGVYEVECCIPKNLLNTEQYSVSIFIANNFTTFKVVEKEVLVFTAAEKHAREGYIGKVIGMVRPKLDWTKPELIANQ